MYLKKRLDEDALLSMPLRTSLGLVAIQQSPTTLSTHLKKRTNSLLVQDDRTTECAFDTSQDMILARTSLVTNSDILSSITVPSGCPTTPQTMRIGIAADCTYTDLHGSASEAMLQIISNLNSVNALFLQTFNIGLQLSELKIMTNCGGTERGSTQSLVQLGWNQACTDEYTIRQRLSDFSLWRGEKVMDDVGLWHLVTNCRTGSSIGLGYFGSICVTNSTRVSSISANYYTSGTSLSSASTVEWKVLAHEIGHNFGAIHDCTSGDCSNDSVESSVCCECGTGCNCNGQYLMHPTNNANTAGFSPCSITDICRVFSTVNTCTTGTYFSQFSPIHNSKLIRDTQIHCH